MSQKKVKELELKVENLKKQIKTPNRLIDELN